jgi:glycosyltransferase involved in cell wall biosynthesis
VNNKFVIICCSYNNEDWVETHIESILEQTYTNYEVVYVNDASTDNTLEMVTKLVGNDKRFHIINNPKNLDSPTNYFTHTYDFMKGRDDDILVELCGDDWFATPKVLEQLNEVYNKTNCWLTYGGMRVWEGGDTITLPSPQNGNYDPLVHKHSLYRRDHWKAGHLHSFRWFLHKQFKWEDTISRIDNEIFKHAIDLQLQFSLMEMTPPDKIVNLDFPTLVFNNEPSRRENVTLKDGTHRHSKENEKYEDEIRNKKKFKRVQFREELNRETLPQVNFFGDYRERHTIPTDFSYVYNRTFGDFDLVLFQDETILEYLNGNIKIEEDVPKVALVAEPPHLFNQKKVYESVLNNHNKFDRVLSWNKKLSHLPNYKFKPVTEINQWNLLPDELDTSLFRVYSKDKLVSMVSSNKTLSKGHQFRMSCVDAVRDSVDVYGRGINEIKSKLDALREYRFSVTIENGKFDNWFTEKIIDCFLSGTIPIYHGCDNIGDYFNMDGIVTFDTIDELKSIISNLNNTAYDIKLDAIKDNFNRALDWWEDNDIFFNKHLKDLI